MKSAYEILLATLLQLDAAGSKLSGQILFRRRLVCLPRGPSFIQTKDNLIKLDIWGNVGGGGCVLCGMYTELECVKPNRNHHNGWIWTDNYDKVFFVQSAYKVLSTTLLQLDASVFRIIWSNIVPSKISVFA